MKKILVTGTSSRTGKRFLPFIKDRYHIRAVQRKPDSNYEDSICLDITTDMPGLIKAMEGVDVVIHLAIAGGEYKNEEEYNEAMLNVNIRGAYNILESARKAKVKKVICASSVVVVWGYNRGKFLTTNIFPCVGEGFGVYGASKIFMEVLGEYYARKYDMSVICLRIGASRPDTEKPLTEETVGKDIQDIDVQVSYVDLARGFISAIENTNVHFGIYYLISDNENLYYDLKPGKEELGYEPVHKFTRENIEVLREYELFDK